MCFEDHAEIIYVFKTTQSGNLFDRQTVIYQKRFCRTDLFQSDIVIGCDAVLLLKQIVESAAGKTGALRGGIQDVLFPKRQIDVGLGIRNAAVCGMVAFDTV